MNQNYEKLFSRLVSSETPENLLEKILSRIQKERQKAHIRRLVIFSLFSSLSAVAVIPAFRYAQVGFLESGFWHYFKLIFSDFGAIAGVWQNYVLSLLEALPVVGLIIFLSSLLLFINLIKLLVGEIGNYNSLKQLKI